MIDAFYQPVAGVAVGIDQTRHNYSTGGVKDTIGAVPSDNHIVVAHFDDGVALYSHRPIRQNTVFTIHRHNGAVANDQADLSFFHTTLSAGSRSLATVQCIVRYVT